MIKVFPERICGEPVEVPEFVPLEIIQKALIQEAKARSIPIMVELDKVKLGKGLSGIGAQTHPCIAIYHSKHKRNYYSIILIETQQYGCTFATKYLGGESSNYLKTISHNNSIIADISKNRAKNALQDEHIYYDAVHSLINIAYHRAVAMKHQAAAKSAPPPPVSRPATPPQSKPTSPPTEYIFFDCPKCHRKYRAPKGRGHIRVTCSNCGMVFDKYS